MNPKKINQQYIWAKYQLGKNYIDGKGMVDKTQQQWRFYLGDQWEGLETGGEVMPSYNFIKPVVRYKVATICSNKMTATYSDLQARDEMNEITEAMNIKFQSNWEKADMNSLSWKAIKASAIQGDSYVYWYGDNKYQLLDNVSVLLGDEQNPNIQEQPYIIIRERVFVPDIKEIAKLNGLSAEEIDLIVSDQNNNYQLDNKTDIEYEVDDGKATSLIFFTKDDDGVVWYGRCTQTCMYQPMEPIKYSQGGERAGKGLKLYPIVNYVWEDCPNNARGKAEVRELIPNQIRLNQVLAQRAISIKQCAFPRLAYDSTAVSNPEDIDKIGSAIEVTGGNAQSVNQLVSYLNPAGLNAEGSNFANELMSVTRDLAGAGDTALGQIDPTRVSGSALSLLQEQSGVNTAEQVNKYEKWVEDTARLWWEMSIVFNDTVVLETVDADGIIQETRVTPKQMEELEPDVRVDVSEDTAYTKEAVMEALNGLLESGQISLEEWTQLLPQNSPLPKNELLQLLQQRVPPEMAEGETPEEATPEEMPEEGAEYELPEMQQ